MGIHATNNQVTGNMLKLTILLFIAVASVVCHSNDVVQEVSKLKERVEFLEKRTHLLTRIIQQGGYDKFTIQDSQWQSLHMSAASACRAISGDGAVYAQSMGETCSSICKKSQLKHCAANMFIMGVMGKAGSSGVEVARYHSGSCSDDGKSGGGVFETSKGVDSTSLKGSYVGYCCCY